MPAFRLLAKLVIYYAILAAIVAITLWLVPGAQEHLPIGRVQTLIAEADGGSAAAQAAIVPAAIGGSAIEAVPRSSFGTSLIWLVAAVAGALLASLPVSWVYMKIRNPAEYDQSLIDTIVVLPLVVTSIVVVVQNSLALSFSLAGIAGAARYRNTLKSSGDLLFILLSIGIGLAAGIGAVELAVVSSAAFNFCFVTLWFSNYGERKDMKRFLGEFDDAGADRSDDVVTTTKSTTVVAQSTQTVEVHADTAKDIASR